MAFSDLFYFDSYNTSSTAFLPKEIAVEENAAKYLLYIIACGQETLPTGFQYSCHAFPGYGLIYLHSGVVQYNVSSTFSSSVHTLKSENLFLFDCRIPHSFHALAPSEYELIYFDGCPAPFYSQKLLESGLFPLSISHISETYSLLHRLTDADALTNSLLCHKLLTDLLTGLVMMSQPQVSSTPTYLVQIKKELETQYFQSFTLQMLEDFYQVSRYRICKDFKTYFNTSPMQYLHEIRIRMSQNLLRDTTMKVHEISYEVGYDNVNHFIAHFKKTAGTTPAEYRKHKSSYL